jgi:GR25 family glycosyltransferase involved in LPS biosynthesis
LAALGITPERIAAFNGRDADVLATGHHARYAPLTGGEIGCFESHRTFWTRVVEAGHPGAFVLEDDMAVASDFGRLTFPDTVMQSADLIKIDESLPRDSHYGTKAVAMEGGRDLVRFLGCEMSTGCYFVTRKGAQKLLSMADRYYLPVDLYMFDWQSPLFWQLEQWKLRSAAAAQLHMVTQEAELDSEFQDRIQGAARPEEQASLKTRLNKVRLRVRRLLQGNSRPFYTARKTKAFETFAKSEPVKADHIRFSTPDTAHFDDILPKVANG